MSLDVVEKKIEMFSLEVLDYQDTDGREKKSEKSIDYSFTSVLFSIGFLMEEIELLESQK